MTRDEMVRTPENYVPEIENGPTRIGPAGLVSCEPPGAGPSRRRFHQPHGFAARLGLAFALVAALTAGFAGVFASFTWATQFETYVRGNLQTIADGVATAAANAYSVTGNWGFVTISSLPQTGRGSDIAVQILDESGQIIYDEAELRQHAQQMLDATTGMVTPTETLPDDTVPTVRVVTAPVVVGGHTVGTVRVWPYGTHSLLTDRDIQLRAATLWGLAVAGLTAIIIASIAGVAYSRRLVKPIRRITATANALKAGQRDARTCLTGDDEISQLGEVFDAMANSIEAEREQERRLTSDVAHELRTPLMAIQATAEAIEDGIFPADAEHLGRIQAETQRLTRLTNVILELSKLEAGTLTFNFEPIDLSVTVREALDAHEALFDAAELVVETNIAADLVVRGDADRLQVVDAQGRLFNGDEVLYLMVDDRLRRGESVPGVVGTLMTNMAVELALKARGVEFVRAKVGDRYVLEELEKRRWLLGGEGSGHLLALDKHSTGDGLISALQVLQTVVRSGQSLSALLKDVVLFPQTMINVRLQPGQVWQASPQLEPETRAVEAELGQSGRVLIRASGTEPLVRVMVEAQDAAQAKDCAQRIAKTLTL